MFKVASFMTAFHPSLNVVELIALKLGQSIWYGEVVKCRVSDIQSNDGVHFLNQRESTVVVG